MGMTESMQSFLKRHVWLVRAARLSWLSLIFAAALYVCNHYWPAAEAAKSWWWTLTLPNAMIAALAWSFGRGEKAEQDIVMGAIDARLREGRLTSPEKKLALRFYHEFRDKLHDAVVHGGSFRPGEALHLVLCSDSRELQAVLPKLRSAPSDVPALTPDQEKTLARIAAGNGRCAEVIVQWLFLSGGEAAVEKLQQDGIFKPSEAEISGYILKLLPSLPDLKYSEAVEYLKWRRRHLKGRTTVLHELQERLLTSEGQTFEDTVAVIGGINGEQGKAALDACWRELPRGEKRRRETVDHEIAALTERLRLAAQPSLA
ncbi:hypothetical protein [Pseudacidobacterium ailaaui]|jgi:hypothetical protein|uniref:hypothetical protein n=1 Tax=Pseudacidobacterium ailaaui TaxID=1382359 RepID=UPI00047D228A|nr:hypothetical protein [Pseudacidobacterium ailaaui]